MKKLQDKVAEFVKKAKIENPPEISAMDTVAELGEVIAEMLKSSAYGKKNFIKTKQLESELGDVFYSLITLANSLNINLDEALELALKKYEERLREKGEAGSGK